MALVHSTTTCGKCGKEIKRKVIFKESHEVPVYGDNTFLDVESYKCSKIKKLFKKIKKWI